MTLAIILASSFAGRGVGRVGAGRMLDRRDGAASRSGWLLFARVGRDGSYLADVLVAGAARRRGLGLSFVPVTIAAVSGVAPRPRRGWPRAWSTPSRQVGGSLGLAVLATLATPAHGGAGRRRRADAAALTAGFHRAFLVGAGFAAVGSVAALLLLVRGVPAARPEPAEAPERAAA